MFYLIRHSRRENGDHVGNVKWIGDADDSEMLLEDALERMKEISTEVEDAALQFSVGVETQVRDDGKRIEIRFSVGQQCDFLIRETLQLRRVHDFDSNEEKHCRKCGRNLTNEQLDEKCESDGCCHVE